MYIGMIYDAEMYKIDSEMVFQILRLEMPTSDIDLKETGATRVQSLQPSISMIPTIQETESLDIEHVPVQNDPREWSSLRKVSFPATSIYLS